MHSTLHRAVAAVLGLSALVVGGWATALPRTFYDSFPLPGHHWVAALPPYNEHLTRDVGGLYLALLVLSAWAVLRPGREAFVVTGLAWEAFSLPHLAFHLEHLAMLSTVDAIGNVVSLGGTVVLAAVLLAVPVRRPADRTNPSRP
jgi:hypothetical protein